MTTHDEMPRSRELLLAILSGACLVLAFPPIDLWPAAFIALVPLFHAVRNVKRGGFWSGFRPGFVAGISFFLLLLYWLALLSSDQMDNPVVMSGPLFLLVLLQSFYWGLFSAAASFVGHRTRIPWFVILPVLWVAFEQLRSLGVIGFTWGALGYAAVNVPRAIQFASVTGVFGVSLWIALSNALVLEVASARRRRGALAVGLLLALLLPVAHGTMVLRGADALREGGAGKDAAGGARRMRVAVIQPNISGETKWDSRYKNESFEALGRLSLEAADRKPDLIIWPETAAPSYLLLEPDDLARVAGIARAADAPILTGCPHLVPGDADEGAGRPLNSVLLIDADGIPRASYSKMKLVPFGEVIPFETVIPFLKEVDFGEADFWPGSERTVFEHPRGRFATLICYESTFPRLARRFVADGAELLVNITNDVWYGETSMPFQHASMAVMRAVENRRSLARSANSGVSMLVDPYGRVLARTGIFEEGFLVEGLPVVSRTTFYTRYGDVLPWGASIAGGLMLVLVLFGAAGSRGGRQGRRH
ncbi:MAG: apolipoprotein N-acyltransferase [Candidatus Eisenbacteria bacterium]